LSLELGRGSLVNNLGYGIFFYSHGYEIWHVEHKKFVWGWFPIGSFRRLSKYKSDLVEVQDVRWNECGTEPAGEHTFFFGKWNENRELGTGFLCI
jgi:hypothetical protein